MGTDKEIAEDKENAKDKEIAEDKDIAEDKERSGAERLKVSRSASAHLYID